MLFRVTLLFLLSAPILVGFLWMFISTFAVRTHGLMPVDAQGNFGGLTLANWAFLKDPVLWTAFGNTFLLAAGLTVLTVLISSMAGYALARIQFRFRKQLLSLTLVLHAFPSVTLLIAIYFVLKGLSASPVVGPWIGYNTMGGVILVSVAMQLPLGIWLMKGFSTDSPGTSSAPRCWTAARAWAFSGASRCRWPVRASPRFRSFRLSRVGGRFSSPTPS